MFSAFLMIQFENQTIENKTEKLSAAFENIFNIKLTEEINYASAAENNSTVNDPSCRTKEKTTNENHAILKALQGYKI